MNTRAILRTAAIVMVQLVAHTTFAQTDGTASPNKPQHKGAAAHAKKCGCEPGTGSEAIVIELDMNDSCKGPDLSCLESLEKGEYYRVRISHLNLNLYKVSVNGKDSSTATAVNFPTFGDFGLDAISTLVGGVGSVVSKVTTYADKGVASVDELMQSNTPGGADQINAKRRAMGLYSDVAAFVPTDPKMHDIQKRLNAFSRDIGASTETLIQLKTTIDSLQLAVQLRMLELKRVSAPPSGGIDYKNALDRVLVLRNRLQKEQKEIANAQKTYQAMLDEEGVMKLIESDKDTKALNDRIAAGFGKLQGTITEAIASMDASKSATMLEGLQVLEANAGHIYVSAPIQYNGGDAQVDIVIAPLKGEYNLQSYNTSFKFPLKDPSYVGVSAGFYGCSLYNDAFSTSSRTLISGGDTSQVYDLVNEESVRKEVGADLLFTYGRKCKDGGSFGYHAVIGPGVSLAETVRPRLLVGGGVSLGKEHMLMLNVGAIVGFVDRRSNAYPTDGPYSGEPSNPTVARLDGSLFFSVGYLFKL
jgi:flagellar motility protein MotE (MotC chaperone)